MARYVLTLRPFNGPSDFGEPTHGQLVDTDANLNDPAGYYLLLKEAAKNVGSGIVGKDDYGNNILLRDTVE